MIGRFRRLPAVDNVTAGPFHLVCRPFEGEYRNQRSIAALRGGVYQDLLNRHSIIGFDGATLYLDLNERWTGKGLACIWLRDNPEGVEGANRRLQAHFGNDAIPLENSFQRDWDRVLADDHFENVLIPEQPVLETRVPYRGEATARRWTLRILPLLMERAREKNHRGDAILEVTDMIRKELRYLVLSVS
ncbi:MAG: hypothetical protein EA427_15820 [Spirochaetaceae bacterium]|nr:MAG: hypothetical protein EA427_15820 [Spirochaetaceae bacterium]